MTTLAPLFKKHGIDDPAGLMAAAMNIAETAGQIIMGYYNAAATDSAALQMELKSDNSPITAADKASSAYIESRLAKLTPGIAIVSEENTTSPEAGQPFWSIDPLDGTKLFINRTGGFAVNIALILDHTPVIGVVNCPAFATSYYSHAGGLSYKTVNGSTPERITTRRSFAAGDLKTYFDAAHARAETYEVARAALCSRHLTLPDPDTTRCLPHNLMVAEGQYDLHVKTGKDVTLQACSGRSWDNAADCVILRNAGGAMVSLTLDEHTGAISGRHTTFERVRDRMQAYISFGDRQLAHRVFPELKTQGFSF